MAAAPKHHQERCTLVSHRRVMVPDSFVPDAGDTKAARRSEENPREPLKAARMSLRPGAHRCWMVPDSMRSTSAYSVLLGRSMTGVLTMPIDGSSE